MLHKERQYRVLVEVAIPTESDYYGAKQADQIRDFASSYGDVVLFVDGFDLGIGDTHALDQINAILGTGAGWPGAMDMVKAILRRTGRVEIGQAARGSVEVHRNGDRPRLVDSEAPTLLAFDRNGDVR